MTIMEADGAPVDKDVETVKEDDADKKTSAGETGGDGGGSIFSDDNLPNESELDAGESKPAEDIDLMGKRKTIAITPEEKVSFIDSVVNNSRFRKEYSLFGGRVKFTVRSLTTEEVAALSTWLAKTGSSDTAGLVSGKYRKYLMAAQIERYDGVDMPPLEEPLYETLGSDGKTVAPPGWIDRSKRWENMPVGLFNAIMECLADFDLRYSMLCKEAENANFWNPDTP